MSISENNPPKTSNTRAAADKPPGKCCELKTPGGATVSGCSAPCAWCCCVCCCEPMMQPMQERAQKEVEKQLASEGESVLKRAITQALKDVVIQLDAPENETMEGRGRGTSTIQIVPKAEYEASQRERAASAAAEKKDDGPREMRVTLRPTVVQSSPQPSIN